MRSKGYRYCLVALLASKNRFVRQILEYKTRHGTMNRSLEMLFQLERLTIDFGLAFAEFTLLFLPSGISTRNNGERSKGSKYNFTIAVFFRHWLFQTGKMSNRNLQERPRSKDMEEFSHICGADHKRSTEHHGSSNFRPHMRHRTQNCIGLTSLQS